MIRKTVMLFMTVLMLLALPAASQALQVGVGASAWYADWIFENTGGGEDNDAEFDPSFLYGPILTLGFSPQWGLSGVFLYGRFNQSNTGGGPGGITRFDSDIALNYSINRYFKVFAGFKYMGYNFDEGDHAGYGPGFGISVVAPFTDNLFLVGSLSGLYIWGHHKDQGNDYDYNEPGYNTSISLAYRFTGASTVISLGFRYQYFNTQPESSSMESDLNHTFYGATLSAIYSFSI